MSVEDDLKKLAADGRAKKARRDADTLHAEAAAKHYAETAEAIRKTSVAVWRMTRTAARFPHNAMHLVVLFGTFLASLRALPYFRYFVTGVPVPGRGKRILLDPARDGYLPFYLFLAVVSVAVLLYVVRFLIGRRALRAYREERAWAHRLPWQMLGFPDELGDGTRRYRLDLQFAGATPAADFMQNVLAALDARLEYSSHSHGRVRIELKYEDGNEDANANHFLGLIHQLTDSVLLRVHAEYPLTSVTLDA